MVASKTDDKRDEHRHAAEQVGIYVSFSLTYLLCKPRHEQRSYKSARYDCHRKERVHRFFVHDVFSEIQSARVGKKHSRRAAYARQNYEHKGFVFEEKLQIVFKRRRSFRRLITFYGIFESDEE